MAELVPQPFPNLLRRLVYELRHDDAIFHLPRKKWWTPDPAGPDLSIPFHGRRIGTPVGPAAGPHTQMAQNLVLSWLAGSRFLELKTVQINDRLKIGRPCIDATNIGFNIEWSQELRIDEALREYVAGAMLIHILTHGNLLPNSPITTHATDTILDLSVGYDLAGISSRPVRAFIEQMQDASAHVAALRDQIPREFAPLRDLGFPIRLSNTITLSTFHGCPADEIEKICTFLIADMDCDVIVKMNPPMLGKPRLEHLLHEQMGYTELRVPDHAYTTGLQFDEGLDICRRLADLARARGRGFGAKFSNTLEVENHRTFFTPENKTQYLSGQPLHVITLTLADEFRRAIGPDIPFTFSAGVDRKNFPALVACGFKAITTCTDLLRPGGYSRLPPYLTGLAAQMQRAGARTIDELILSTTRQSKNDNPTSTSAPPDSPNSSFSIHHSQFSSVDIASAAAQNLSDLAAATRADSRYHAAANRKTPNRTDSHLDTFDCLTCDKCIPVCPNAANFYYHAEPLSLDFTDYIVRGAELLPAEPRHIVLTSGEQIANFADFCNDCGNCDTFCPEYDGPFIKKPNFFGSFASWSAFPQRDGFFLDVESPAPRMHGRYQGATYLLAAEPAWQGYRFEDAAVCLFLRASDHGVERFFAFGPRDAAGHLVNMTAYHTLRILMESMLRDKSVNQVNAARFHAHDMPAAALHNLPQDCPLTLAQLTPLLSTLLSRFSCQSATLHRLNPDTGLLDLIGHQNIPDQLLPIIAHIPIGKGMAGLAAQRKEPVQICNLQIDDSGQAKPAAKLTGMEGAIAVPMLVADQLVGVLGLAKSTPYEFTPDERQDLLQIAADIGAKLSLPQT